jgi:YD repeat-containing protein
MGTRANCYPTGGRLLETSLRAESGAILAKTSFTYDELGRRTSEMKHVLDWQGAELYQLTSTWTYFVGELIESHDPDGMGVYVYEYDGLGRVSLVTTPKGDQIEYAYEKAGLGLSHEDWGPFSIIPSRMGRIGQYDGKKFTVPICHSTALARFPQFGLME